MTEQQIVDLFWNRSEDAIAQTDAAFGRRLRGISCRIIQNREDAEETVNDAYLKTWNAIPKARPKYFFAYIVAICRNLSLNRLDWNQAAKRNAEIVAITEEMEQCIPDSNEEKLAQRKEMIDALNSFLEALPKESRLIFLRRYWYADSVADIAGRYGMTQSKVKMQLLRTRSKLREYLEKEGIRI